jgi:quinol---cytochrome c reductase iron-sulfur subunit, bacillus type
LDLSIAFGTQTRCQSRRLIDTTNSGGISHLRSSIAITAPVLPRAVFAQPSLDPHSREGRPAPPAGCGFFAFSLCCWDTMAYNRRKLEAPQLALSNCDGYSSMSHSEPNRRRFLSFVTKLLTAFLGLLVAVPVIGSFLAPLWRKPNEEAAYIDAGPLSNFPFGEWRLHALEMVQEDGWKRTRVRHAVWVRRQGEDEHGITVLSSICPHLGCPINWHPDRSQFFCPCHGGIFDVMGQRIGGPPPRPMDSLAFEVRAGRLWVRWQDFKIGVAEKTPVSV